ncbi:MAG: transposase [Synechococcus sp. SB0678_bin_12]|nr:transposase [Synechococcus sp. SB0678_bin_12]
MKAHVGVERTRPHSVVATGANVQEVSMAAELLPGEESVFYGDGGYQVRLVDDPRLGKHPQQKSSWCRNPVIERLVMSQS